MLPELPIYTFTPDLVGLLTFAINMLLPLAVGWVTTRVTSAGRKAVLLLGLSAISMILVSVLRALTTDVPWEPIPVIMNVGIAFLLAVAAHFGLWKPLGTATNVQENHGVKSP